MDLFGPYAPMIQRLERETDIDSHLTCPGMRVRGGTPLDPAHLADRITRALAARYRGALPPQLTTSLTRLQLAGTSRARRGIRRDRRTSRRRSEPCPVPLRGALVEYGSDLLGPLPNVVIFQFNPEPLTRNLKSRSGTTGATARESSRR